MTMSFTVIYEQKEHPPVWAGRYSTELLKLNFGMTMKAAKERRLFVGVKWWTGSAVRAGTREIHRSYTEKGKFINIQQITYKNVLHSV